jgi:predicted HTH transcriptional regulator
MVEIYDDKSIATNIKELKNSNVLERVGANKKGYWKILLDLQ